MEGDSKDPLAGLRGIFRLGSRVKTGGKEDWFELGILHVFPASARDKDSSSGQWILSITPDKDSNHRERFFIEVASRLGLLPIHFAPSLEGILRSNHPLCIVADTNTLYHGTLTQALRLREGRATHVAIADIAMMEMQRQREKAWRRSGPVQEHQDERTPAVAGQMADEYSAEKQWAGAADRSRYLAAGGRTLDRLRRAGHVVHVARPPAAMVRYFGGSRGTADEDDGTGDGEDVRAGDGDAVGSNLLRDRLILEAAFQQRINLPGVQIVLLTDDALLAEQAKIEGLTVGFGWKTNTIRPRLLTSPYIDPRTLELMHVPIRDFLEEVVWSCSVLTLQQADTGKIEMGRVPDKKRERALAAMGEPGFGIRWSDSQTNDIWGPPQSGTAVPRKAPPAQKLLESLLSWFAAMDPMIDKTWKIEDAKVIDTYLEALGWLADQGGKKGLTARGQRFASRWLDLDTKDVPGWVDWMLDAGRDLDRLAPVRAMLQLVESQPGITDKDLAKVTGDSDRTVSAQMNLAGAFGRAVRLNAKNWTSAPWTNEDAEQAVLLGIKRLMGESSTGLRAVSVVPLFTSFLRTKPMSLTTFRAALDRLRRAGHLRFSGSSPERRDVKMRVLERIHEDPGVRVRDVDLGHGDFLLPGIPSVMVEIVPKMDVKPEDA